MSTEDNDAPIRGFTQDGTPVLVSESDDVFSPPLKDHAGAETPAGQSTSSPRTVIANKASVSDQNLALSPDSTPRRQPVIRGRPLVRPSLRERWALDKRGSSARSARTHVLSPLRTRARSYSRTVKENKSVSVFDFGSDCSLAWDGYSPSATENPDPHSMTKSTQFSVPVSVHQTDDSSAPPSTDVSTVIQNDSSPSLTMENHEEDDLFTLERLIMEVNDDFKDLNPTPMGVKSINTYIQTANGIKRDVQHLMLKLSRAKVPEYTPELKQQATEAKVLLVSFIRTAEAALGEREATAPQLAGNPTMTADLTTGTEEILPCPLPPRGVSAIRTQRVQHSKDHLVSEVQQLVQDIQELTVQEPDTASRFAVVNEQATSIKFRAKSVREDSIKIISDAEFLGIGNQVLELDRLIMQLRQEERELEQRLQGLKSSFGPTSMKAYSEVPLPKFSGKPGDGSDFYTFQRDWNRYSGTRCVGQDELLSILILKCLEGPAKVACRDLRTVDSVFAKLKTNYGNPRYLFTIKSQELHKLGKCSGTDLAQREWIIEVRARLDSLYSLCAEHSIEELLYHSDVTSRIQSNLPEKVYERFLEKMQDEHQDGEINRTQMFHHLLDYLKEVEDRLTFLVNFKVNTGRSAEKPKDAPVTAIKKSALPDSARAKRQHVVVDGFRDGFTSTGTRTGRRRDPSSAHLSRQRRSGSGSSVESVSPVQSVSSTSSRRSARVSKPVVHAAAASAAGKSVNASGPPQKSGSKVNRAAPALIKCKLCNQQHKYLFYCKEFQETLVMKRTKLVQTVKSCYRCLRMDADMNVNDRANWWPKHAPMCDATWICQEGGCGKRQDSRQWHFLMCQWHLKENKSREDDFIKTLDARFLPKDTRFFFNFRSFLALPPPSQPFVAEAGQLEKVPDVFTPTIFMLHHVKVNDRSLLLFYDSGCSGAALSDRAAVALESRLIRPGPTLLGVAGGKTIVIDRGDEQFCLPLANQKQAATITGLRMPEVTTPFPKWDISKAWDEIHAEFRASFPGKSEGLPTHPDSVGGTDVDIMIGIRYARHFPILLYTLPSGLQLHKAVIAAADGHQLVLGGPHGAWCTAVSNINVMGARAYFSAEARAFSCQNRALYPVAGYDDFSTQEPAVVPPDDVTDVCVFRHCAAHAEDNDWIYPPSWKVDYVAENIRKEASSLEQVERCGSEISYRCLRCRNCPECRKGEILEEVSLKEEHEQYLIDQSVEFQPSQKLIIAKLPFLKDPAEFLKPNRRIAESILQSQLRLTQRSEEMRLDVVAAHEKLRSRGFVAPVADLPVEVQKDLVSHPAGTYVIPWRVVHKASSLSTPCRMVFDASSKTPGGESLNGILAKGMNNLASLISVLLKFRFSKAAFTCDIRMAYNNLKLHHDHLRHQLYLWKEDLDPSSPTILMAVNTLIYGVRPVGNQLGAGLEQVADHVQQHHPQHAAGADAVRRDRYVDDILRGAESKAAARTVAASVDFLLSQASMSVKTYTFSGDVPDPEVSADGVHVGALGLLWDPKLDIISVDVKPLFFGKIRRGKRPDPVTGDIREALEANFTRRNLLSKVAGVYDPLGLLTPVTSKFKLDLHDLCVELRLDWDDRVPEKYLDVWVQNLTTIQQLSEVKFCRTVVPEDAANLKIHLLISCDASQSIAIAAVHARMLRRCGMYSCQLVTAKSKIVRDTTIPKAELKAAVMAASLGHVVRGNLEGRYSGAMFVTDSTIALSWITQDQRPLQTMVRNAVLEIRRFTDVQDWFHVDGTENIADLGTRFAKVEDVCTESEWQQGKSWMTLPKEEMPVRSITEVTLTGEEKRKVAEETRSADVQGIPYAASSHRLATRYSFCKYLLDPNRYPWDKTLRILALVFRFIKKVRPVWKPVWMLETPPQLSTTDGMISPLDCEISSAANYYFQVCTKELKYFSKEKIDSNMTLKNGILYYAGRILQGTHVDAPEDPFLDVDPLMFVCPVVDRFSPVAAAIMIHAHTNLAMHKSVNFTLRESRNVAFILRGRDLAAEVRASCQFCKRYRAKLVEVEMGKIHQDRLRIAPAFYISQVDLFGPVIARCEHNHRSSLKAYGVVFKDPGSCAVAVYTMPTYDTGGFLQAYTRFAARYGHPKLIRIDQGTQLMKAAQQMEIGLIDLSEQLRVKYQVGVEYTTCAAGHHQAHGAVERSIREVKKLMDTVFRGTRLDLLSLETCFAWVSNELNNLPICLGSRSEDLDTVDIITPSRLLLGRNNRRAMAGFARLEKPGRLVQQMDDIYEAWWKVWEREKLVDFIPQPAGWNRKNVAVDVGDIVLFLRADPGKSLGQTLWKLGRVTEVEVSVDGVVRTVQIEYPVPGQRGFGSTKRDVRKIAVVHKEDDVDLIQELNEASREAGVSYFLCQAEDF